VVFIVGTAIGIRSSVDETDCWRRGYVVNEL